MRGRGEEGGSTERRRTRNPHLPPSSTSVSLSHIVVKHAAMVLVLAAGREGQLAHAVAALVEDDDVSDGQAAPAGHTKGGAEKWGVGTGAGVGEEDH